MYVNYTLIKNLKCFQVMIIVLNELNTHSKNFALISNLININHIDESSL